MIDIADVSNFVLPDNPMDDEAASRGTTVYLVDKRIDMLPALLGTNLCSLRPFVERLAFSAIWVSAIRSFVGMTRQLTVPNYSYRNSTLKRRSSTYASPSQSSHRRRPSLIKPLKIGWTTSEYEHCQTRPKDCTDAVIAVDHSTIHSLRAFDS